MSAFDNLTSWFRKFPGIGPRQAKRFVYFLLSQKEVDLNLFADLVRELRKEIRQCDICFRFFPKGEKHTHLTLPASCPTCNDPNRLNEILMVVPKDVDFEIIEKSGSFEGRYFILGGTVDLLSKENAEENIRTKELKERVKTLASEGLKEVIVASNLTPEGEHTAEIVMRELSPLAQKYGLKISALGRGLSTGTELEYVDSETIKNALKNRA